MARKVHAGLLVYLFVLYSLDRVSSRRFRRQDGLHWIRECAWEYDVPINADEGIIETPVPGPFPSNCGGPMTPGVCCRWRINISNPKLYVEISILDSTVPAGKGGTCSTDNVISVLDRNRRKVESVCGPVSTRGPIVVPSAGALIRFSGLIQDGAMATIHYKMIGCEPLPAEAHSSPLVVSVESNPLRANVTCSSGLVHVYTCIGHVWNPVPGVLTCPRVTTTTTTIEPTKGMFTTKTMGGTTTVGPPTDDQSAAEADGQDTSSDLLPAGVGPTTVTRQVGLVPGAAGNQPTSSVPYDVLTQVIASETEHAVAPGGGGGRGGGNNMNTTQLALIIVGTLAVVLLLCIFLVLLLRRPRKKKTKTTEAVSKENAYQAAPVLPPIPIDDGYTDLYDEIGPYLESEPYVPPEPERAMIMVRPPYQYYPSEKAGEEGDPEELEPLDLTEELVRSLDMVDDIVEDILAEDPYAVPDKKDPNMGNYDNPDTGNYDNPDTGNYDNPDTGNYDNPDGEAYDNPDSGPFNDPDTGIYDNPEEEEDTYDSGTHTMSDHDKPSRDTNSSSDSEPPAVPKKNIPPEPNKEVLYAVPDKEKRGSGVRTNVGENAKNGT